MPARRTVAKAFTPAEVSGAASTAPMTPKSIVAVVTVSSTASGCSRSRAPNANGSTTFWMVLLASSTMASMATASPSPPEPYAMSVAKAPATKAPM